ncbi:uncharacterized protein LOC111381868 [Olea europaea var. sylvestris]|uniref:uncharacterized protein LOC111381868 n=1 Tax=Olea europaea var. sylvestris TaxID=158386 RepID=UPI000C1D7F3E|nr:uncharacterized protein LOC111381868 [Olea europaea var. sylvestris]
MAGRVKINVDGSSLGNPGQAGGEGMIRNDKGMVLAAFATNFGIASNNEAELRAIIEGLKLCQHIGCFHVDIECDSKIVVEWMLKRKCTVWKGNQVADLLAKMGAQGLMQRFTSCGDLPEQARGLVRLDRIGVLYLHK